MAEIIDVMMTKLSLSPYFDVDTTGPDYVDINPPVAPIMDFYSADITKRKFARGDNVQLLSMGYFIPENFCTYEMGGVNYAVPSWRIYGYRVTSAASVALNQFGAFGMIQSPFPNYEMSMGVFLDAETVLGEDFYLQIEVSEPGRISMIGVPAILNTKRFHVIPFVKILHNFNLS